MLIKINLFTILLNLLKKAFKPLAEFEEGSALIMANAAKKFKIKKIRKT